MKRKHLRYIAGFWFGFSLSQFAKLTIFDWEYYIIIIPVIVLFVYSQDDPE